jgi:hypothetical protein
VIYTPLEVVSATAQTTGDVVTMPYTVAPLAKQPMSSRVTNINPFSVFSWKGVMQLTPSKDTWTVIEELPANFTNSTETITVSRPWSRSGSFASAPVAVSWWNDSH